MTRKQVIKKYFDKSSQLTIKNINYRNQIEVLFDFLCQADGTNNDISTKLILKSIRSSRPLPRLAYIVAKQPGVAAGIEEVLYCLRKKTKLKVEAKCSDGSAISEKNTVITIEGNFAEILAYERVVLNILQRMSGIATEANKLQKAAGKTRIAATRKTLWGWLDKKAVAVGGGLTHRLSLSDEILIKDNHKTFRGVQSILSMLKCNMTVEIEVDSHEVTVMLADQWNVMYPKKPLIIMLDNFSVEQAKKTILIIKKSNIIIELSGGISQNNLGQFTAVGADVISLGALTHSAPALDMSLELN